LYKERAIRKQDTKDDTFDSSEDKDQSTSNHFNFRIAKYIKQLFLKKKKISFSSSSSSFFFFLNNYVATYANYTTRNRSKQRTNANENGIKIWKITDMEVKARIQIWKIEANIQIWKIKAKIQIWKVRQRFKSGN